MLQKHHRIAELIDGIPEDHNSITEDVPEAPKLDQLFMERDKAIDEYNIIRRSLELHRCQIA